jgi:GNAT superfamily N-acetyltransferase
MDASPVITSRAAESVLIVAADHPSLIDARERFAVELRAEQRFFGRSAATPKPFPSFIATLLTGDGSRLAAIIDGEIVGLACIRPDGEALVAVVERWRGQGLATALLRAAIERAQLAGHSMVFIRSSRRSPAVAAIGAALGGTVVDLGRGRIELILTMGDGARTG